MKGATGEKIVRKKNAWDISIHAPVKGATSRGRRFFPDLRISIHAPVKGATVKQEFQGVVYALFQSTHP